MLEGEIAMDTSDKPSSSVPFGATGGTVHSEPALPRAASQPSRLDTAEEAVNQDTPALPWDGDGPSPTSTTAAQLIEQCMYGVAMCAVRCPAYFKPLYRLASVLLRQKATQVRETEGREDGKWEGGEGGYLGQWSL